MNTFKFSTTYLGGRPRFIEEPYLTVDGEPEERPVPDLIEAYLRNEARWLGGRHRIHERPVRLEPLWNTHIPQVPNPNIIKMEVDGQVTFVAHPVTMRRMMDTVGRPLTDAINQETMRMWML
jgi:hypothetical protein